MEKSWSSFVLARPNSLSMGLPWSMDDVASDTPVVKTNFPFASNYQLQIAFCLEVGPCVHFLLLVL